ncbi:MAG: hypothetical protein RSC43_00860 [Clostridia bacterium]
MQLVTNISLEAVFQPNQKTLADVTVTHLNEHIFDGFVFDPSVSVLWDGDADYIASLLIKQNTQPVRVRPGLKIHVGDTLFYLDLQRQYMLTVHPREALVV